MSRYAKWTLETHITFRLHFAWTSHCTVAKLASASVDQTKIAMRAQVRSVCHRSSLCDSLGHTPRVSLLPSDCVLCSLITFLPFFVSSAGATPIPTESHSHTLQTVCKFDWLEGINNKRNCPRSSSCYFNMKLTAVLN